MTGRFIALEGPDGIGKSTLAAALADLTYQEAITALNTGRGPAPGGSQLVLVRRRQQADEPAYSRRLMQHLSTMLWHSGDDPCLSDAFWVALQAAWGVAHTETVLNPLLNAGYDVLVDGWFYKLFAKLVAVQGWQQGQVEVIFSRVRMPDAVILLTGDLGAVYDRRSDDFRPAELGMHAGYDQLDRDTFITYQTQALHRMRDFAAELDWTTVDLDPGDDVAASTAKLRPHLDAALQKAIPTPTSA